jgi:hypothetical protein
MLFSCFVTCTADDVEVTGIVSAQWRPLFPGARCDGSLMLQACHMRTINSLHRVVAPPPDGLSEQFRCVRGMHCTLGRLGWCFSHKLHADASRPCQSTIQ